MKLAFALSPIIFVLLGYISGYQIGYGAAEAAIVVCSEPIK